MWKKTGGVGKEWDFVCLHECVASSLGSWQEGEKEGEQNLWKVFFVPADPALNLLSPPL